MCPSIHPSLAVFLLSVGRVLWIRRPAIRDQELAPRQRARIEVKSCRTGCQPRKWAFLMDSRPAVPLVPADVRAGRRRGGHMVGGCGGMCPQVKQLKLSISYPENSGPCHGSEIYGFWAAVSHCPQPESSQSNGHSSSSSSRSQLSRFIENIQRDTSPFLPWT